MRVIPGLLLAALPLAAVTFNRDVRPVLSDNCFSCHGPDEKARMAGLRLDTRDGLLSRVKPGDPAASPLYQRISHANQAMRMPPVASARTLTPQQTGAIRQWITEGAKWETHWSYLAPVRPDPPKVKNRRWVRNPIDQFVLARLEQEGLAPSPEASRETLLRRVTLDLTGLPPAQAEMDAFLADRSADAYSKAVNRLLESPHYGEKMALHWLDLARYADSHGYHIDPHRDMWPWRDWVIQSFNRNQRFDEFVVEQVAGDLLPGATQQQKLASGFNRNHMINFEGGAIPEEYQTEYVIDRVETTSNVFLGMTMGCARCHDHKYDPISQRDFYRFFAFFNGIPEKGLDGTAGNAAPFLFLTSSGQEQEMDALRGDIKQRKEAFKEKEIAGAQAEWEKGWKEPALVTAGILAHWEFDGSLADSSGGYRHARMPGREPEFVAGVLGKSLSFGEGSFVTLGRIAVPRNGTVSMWFKHTTDKELPVLQGGGLSIRSVDVEYVPDRKLGAQLEIATAEGTWRTKDRFLFNQWVHLVWHTGSLHIDGKPAPLVRTGGGRAVDGPVEVRGFRGQMDDVRLYGRALAAEEIDALAALHPAGNVIGIESAKRSKEDKDRLRAYFLARAAPAAMRGQHAEIERLDARLFHLEHLIPSTMVMQEMEKPRDTFILGRGDYRNKGEKVTPAVPAALPPLPGGAPANRLGLARWLVSPDHPLTARVTVNRFWQNFFGVGLVKTSEDFGSQGEAPSNQALLDWLASELVASGWDVKAMQRLIVMSAAYRQSSRVSPALLERDPENRLLARGPRFRLQAELVRDAALAASGLLSQDVGGRSVLPYQPPGLWEEMAFGGTFSMQAYKLSEGRDLYRRSMYTFWKRTVPPAQMAAFDAPDREKCTSRRPVTNTPLQALIQMNDPTYVEAARELAARTIRTAGPDPARRLQWSFRQVVGRAPDAAELEVLRESVDRQMAIYRADPASAAKLIAVGSSKPDAAMAPAELAAWTTVASMILQLDEAITKE
ncbi:MAG: DUF1553 domain-containing protein [Acidobacteria bacterium]|nr:DUF1553 domain-containing protein [Acidobacteriota bacterium]